MPLSSAQIRTIQKRHLARTQVITGCETEAVYRDDHEFNTGYITIVAKFGVAADGVVDDTVAVQKAIDHVLDKGGGSLIFGLGTYLLDSVKCGPGLTLWGYGARILKPGIRFYLRKYLASIHHGLDEHELTDHINKLRALAYVLGGPEIDLAIVSLTHTPEELSAMETNQYLGLAELATLRAKVTTALGGLEPDDALLLTLIQRLKGGRSHAKWARTFQTYESIHSVDQYHYRGEKDSAPIVFKGFCFDGNRAEMGIYTNYELQQQHMIFLGADRYSLGRLTAYLRDLSFKEGVGDAISLHTNVRVYIRNIHATNVFRGGVTNTGGNCRVDMADIKTDGDVHPTGIDWEVDGPSFTNNGLEMAAPQYHSWVKAQHLDIEGDFDLGMRGGSFIGSDIVVRNAPVNIMGSDSVIRIRNSYFRAGAVLTSSRVDEIQRGRFSFLIQYPKNIRFENTTFHALAPSEGELNRPLAFYSLMTLIMYTRYFEPKNYRLRFTRCKFLYDPNLPENAETRVLSSGNDYFLNNNGVVFDSCTAERGFDYGLHIGGGAGAHGNWGSVGGGSFRIVNSTFNTHTGVFLGSGEAFRTRADLRGLSAGPNQERLFEKPIDGNGNAYFHGELMLPD